MPNDIRNLLVPVAVSSSHVGFSAIRYENIWMPLGEAAGLAADLSIERDLAVDEIPVSKLQRLLHERHTATIYVSDVLPGDDAFQAVQWWGTNGGLHGLNPRPDSIRGDKFISGYYKAFPEHNVRLYKPLEEDVRSDWLDLARSLDLPVADLKEAETRGEFIRKAYEHSLKQNR